MYNMALEYVYIPCCELLVWVCGNYFIF